LRIALGHRRQDFAGRGIDALKCPAGSRLDPLAVDQQQLRLAIQERMVRAVEGLNDVHGSQLSVRMFDLAGRCNAAARSILRSTLPISRNRSAVESISLCQSRYADEPGDGNPPFRRLRTALYINEYNVLGKRRLE
jgi:hypothetical protein